MEDKSNKLKKYGIKDYIFGIFEFDTYINSIYQDNTTLLNSIEKEALETDVPIIRKETQNCMKMLLAMHRPENILEVGTGIGFSSIFMYTYNPTACKITTIENYEKRIPIAQENFKRAGVADEVHLIAGDAMEVMQ